MLKTPTPWPYPSLIAHRGAGRFAPENTLAAIRLGATHGFTMVEYDVKFTRDGVAVLLHDDTVDRTSNGTGNAAEQSFNELASLDFGAWHSPRFAGEPIATLHSVAAFTRANGVSSNIEIKPHTGTDAHTGTQVARLARQLWAGTDTALLLSSFSEMALEAARIEAPELARALLVSDHLPGDWNGRLARLGCIGLNLNEAYTTQAIVETVRTAGYKIAVWTVNKPQRARELLDWGCHAVFTDEITSIHPNR